MYDFLTAFDHHFGTMSGTLSATKINENGGTLIRTGGLWNRQRVRCALGHPQTRKMHQKRRDLGLHLASRRLSKWTKKQLF